MRSPISLYFSFYFLLLFFLFWSVVIWKDGSVVLCWWLPDNLMREALIRIWRCSGRHYMWFSMLSVSGGNRRVMMTKNDVIDYVYRKSGK